MTGRLGGFVLLAVAIVLNATGQVLLKRATLGREAGAPAIELFFSPWFVLGAAAHAATMIVWMLALRRLPLTVAHPWTGAVFVAVPIASHLLWSEPLGPQRMIGIGIIAFGIAVVASSGV